MTDYIAITSFPITAQSCEAFSGLTAQADRLDIASDVTVEVDDPGHVPISKANDPASSFGFGTGSVTSLLIGTLAGPAGMLLGQGMGVPTGSTADLACADAYEFALFEAAPCTAPGPNVVVLQAAEDSVELPNGEVTRLDGAVIHRSLQEMISEIEARAAAIEVAGEAARKALCEQRREEMETTQKDRVADLREEHKMFVAGMREKVGGLSHGGAK